MGQLEGKIVVVTGSGSGIGKATALALAQEGAKVLVAEIDPPSGEETVRAIGQQGGEAVFVKTDVTREADAQALVKAAVATYGRLDCAVNNAGIEGDTARTAECTTENFERVLSINVMGVFLGMKYQIPQMASQGGGAIVNVASTMGVVAHPDVPAYVASKHAVIGLTKSTALGAVQEGIRVNAVCPGNTNTQLIRKWGEREPEAYAQLMGMTPVGRLAEPQEIANAIVWLCSEASSYCTGHALLIDGGFTSQ
ncbi:MAG: SDR family oxidoreductase [Deltaproteobacteria bacterium]|nr:SDR family oxidoreductase [Deltaproteobacteria bacterium]MBW2417434.1 SDR family oxidoreductase [Deltaproteobacteria bacterium]